MNDYLHRGQTNKVPCKEGHRQNVLFRPYTLGACRMCCSFTSLFSSRLPLSQGHASRHASVQVSQPPADAHLSNDGCCVSM